MEKTAVFQGSALKRLRKARGISVQELSWRIRVTTASIYSMEKGEHQPRASTLARLARALGVKMEAFFMDAV